VLPISHKWPLWSEPRLILIALTLECEGFIRKQPRTPGSIELLVEPTQLPELL